MGKGNAKGRGVQGKEGGKKGGGAVRRNWKRRSRKSGLEKTRKGKE